jgi:hypothetical protein
MVKGGNMVDGARNLYNEHGQIDNMDVARNMADATQKGYEEAETIEKAAAYSSERVLTPEQAEWQRTMDTHLAKRPNAWNDVRDRDGSRVLFSKIPRDYSRGKFENVESVAITEKGAVLIASNRTAVEDGKGEDWSKETPDLLWRISHAHESVSDPSEYMRWKEAVRDATKPDSLIHYLPVPVDQLHQRVEQLSLTELLDKSNEYFSKKADIKPSPISEAAIF